MGNKVAISNPQVVLGVEEEVDTARLAELYYYNPEGDNKGLSGDRKAHAIAMKAGVSVLKEAHKQLHLMTEACDDEAAREVLENEERHGAQIREQIRDSDARLSAIKTVVQEALPESVRISGKKQALAKRRESILKAIEAGEYYTPEIQNTNALLQTEDSPYHDPYAIPYYKVIGHPNNVFQNVSNARLSKFAFIDLPNMEAVYGYHETFVKNHGPSVLSRAAVGFIPAFVNRIWSSSKAFKKQEMPKVERNSFELKRMKQAIAESMYQRIIKYTHNEKELSAQMLDDFYAYIQENGDFHVATTDVNHYGKLQYFITTERERALKEKSWFSRVAGRKSAYEAYLDELEMSLEHQNIHPLLALGQSHTDLLQEVLDGDDSPTAVIITELLQLNKNALRTEIKNSAVFQEANFTVLQNKLTNVIEILKSKKNRFTFSDEAKEKNEKIEGLIQQLQRLQKAYTPNPATRILADTDFVEELLKAFSKQNLKFSMENHTTQEIDLNEIFKQWFSARPLDPNAEAFLNIYLKKLQANIPSNFLGFGRAKKNQHLHKIELVQALIDYHGKPSDNVESFNFVVDSKEAETFQRNFNMEFKDVLVSKTTTNLYSDVLDRLLDNRAAFDAFLDSYRDFREARNLPELVFSDKYRDQNILTINDLNKIKKAIFEENDRDNNIEFLKSYIQRIKRTDDVEPPIIRLFQQLHSDLEAKPKSLKTLIQHRFNAALGPYGDFWTTVFVNGMNDHDDASVMNNLKRYLSIAYKYELGKLSSDNDIYDSSSWFLDGAITQAGKVMAWELLRQIIYREIKEPLDEQQIKLIGAIVPAERLEKHAPDARNAVEFLFTKFYRQHLRSLILNPQAQHDDINVIEKIELYSELISAHTSLENLVADRAVNESYDFVIDYINEISQSPNLRVSEDNLRQLDRHRRILATHSQLMSNVRERITNFINDYNGENPHYYQIICMLGTEDHVKDYLVKRLDKLFPVGSGYTNTGRLIDGFIHNTDLLNFNDIISETDKAFLRDERVQTNPTAQISLNEALRNYIDIDTQPDTINYVAYNYDIKNFLDEFTNDDTKNLYALKRIREFMFATFARYDNTEKSVTALRNAYEFDNLTYTVFQQEVLRISRENNFRNSNLQNLLTNMFSEYCDLDAWCRWMDEDTRTHNGLITHGPQGFPYHPQIQYLVDIFASEDIKQKYAIRRIAELLHFARNPATNRDDLGIIVMQFLEQYGQMDFSDKNRANLKLIFDKLTPVWSLAADKLMQYFAVPAQLDDFRVKRVRELCIGEYTTVEVGELLTLIVQERHNSLPTIEAHDDIDCRKLLLATLENQDELEDKVYEKLGASFDNVLADQNWDERFEAIFVAFANDSELAKLRYKRVEELHGLNPADGYEHPSVTMAKNYINLVTIDYVQRNTFIEHPITHTSQMYQRLKVGAEGQPKWSPATQILLSVWADEEAMQDYLCIKLELLLSISNGPEVSNDEKIQAVEKFLQFINEEFEIGNRRGSRSVKTFVTSDTFKHKVITLFATHQPQTFNPAYQLLVNNVKIEKIGDQSLDESYRHSYNLTKLKYYFSKSPQDLMEVEREDFELLNSFQAAQAPNHEIKALFGSQQENIAQLFNIFSDYLNDIDMEKVDLFSLEHDERFKACTNMLRRGLVGDRVEFNTAFEKLNALARAIAEAKEFRQEQNDFEDAFKSEHRNAYQIYQEQDNLVVRFDDTNHPKILALYKTSLITLAKQRAKLRNQREKVELLTALLDQTDVSFSRNLTSSLSLLSTNFLSDRLVDFVRAHLNSESEQILAQAIDATSRNLDFEFNPCYFNWAEASEISNFKEFLSDLKYLAGLSDEDSLRYGHLLALLQQYNRYMRGDIQAAKPIDLLLDKTRELLKFIDEYFGEHFKDFFDDNLKQAKLSKKQKKDLLKANREFIQQFFTTHINPRLNQLREQKLKQQLSTFLEDQPLAEEVNIFNQSFAKFGITTDIIDVDEDTVLDETTKTTVQKIVDNSQPWNHRYDLLCDWLHASLHHGANFWEFISQIAGDYRESLSEYFRKMAFFLDDERKNALLNLLDNLYHKITDGEEYEPNHPLFHVINAVTQLLDKNIETLEDDESLEFQLTELNAASSAIIAENLDECIANPDLTLEKVNELYIALTVLASKPAYRDFLDALDSTLDLNALPEYAIPAFTIFKNILNPAVEAPEMDELAARKLVVGTRIALTPTIQMFLDSNLTVAEVANLELNDFIKSKVNQLVRTANITELANIIRNGGHFPELLFKFADNSEHMVALFNKLGMDWVEQHKENFRGLKLFNKHPHISLLEIFDFDRPNLNPLLMLGSMTLAKNIFEKMKQFAIRPNPETRQCFENQYRNFVDKYINAHQSDALPGCGLAYAELILWCGHNHLSQYSENKNYRLTELTQSMFESILEDAHHPRTSELPGRQTAITRNMTVFLEYFLLFNKSFDSGFCESISGKLNSAMALNMAEGFPRKNLPSFFNDTFVELLRKYKDKSSGFSKSKKWIFRGRTAKQIFNKFSEMVAQQDDFTAQLMKDVGEHIDKKFQQVHSTEEDKISIEDFNLYLESQVMLLGDHFELPYITRLIFATLPIQQPEDHQLDKMTTADFIQYTQQQVKKR